MTNAGQPFIGALYARMADNAAANGVVAEIMRPHMDRNPPPLLIGALRFLGFSGAAPAVLDYVATTEHGYPANAEAMKEAWPVFEAALIDHRELVLERALRPPQTNDPRRAAFFYAGLRRLAATYPMPVRLLEAGCSAGILLQLDRFAYVLEHTTVGDPRSAVRLTQPWRRPGVPDTTVEIIERAGCDLFPLHVHTHEGRAGFMSGEARHSQAEMREKAAAADIVTRDIDTIITTADAVDWLADMLAAPTPGVATVVMSSFMKRQLPPQKLANRDAVLAAAGRRASRTSPLCVMELEPGPAEPVGGRIQVKAFAITTYDGGVQPTREEFKAVQDGHSFYGVFPPLPRQPRPSPRSQRCPKRR